MKFPGILAAAAAVVMLAEAPRAQAVIPQGARRPR